jgi:hypothetical protein
VSLLACGDWLFNRFSLVSGNQLLTFRLGGRDVSGAWYEGLTAVPVTDTFLAPLFNSSPHTLGCGPSLLNRTNKHLDILVPTFPVQSYGS